MPMTPDKMVKYLQKNGFQKVDGGKGSHRKMKNFETNRTTVVPMHREDLGKGLEHKILRDAGLK